MVKSHFRIRTDKEFGKVYKFGKSTNSKNFFIKSMPNNLTHPRFGIVVSKKVSKKAVIRNKTKRRIREAAKRTLDSWKNLDLVFYIKNSFTDQPYTEVIEEVETALKKAGAL